MDPDPGAGQKGTASVPGGRRDDARDLAGFFSLIEGLRAGDLLARAVVVKHGEVLVQFNPDQLGGTGGTEQPRDHDKAMQTQDELEEDITYGASR